jgi:hypothetical protein
MGDEIDKLDQQIGKRHLVIAIDDNTGEIELDTDGFASWEVVGIAAFLMHLGEDQLEAAEDEEDDE